MINKQLLHLLKLRLKDIKASKEEQELLLLICLAIDANLDLILLDISNDTLTMLSKNKIIVRDINGGFTLNFKENVDNKFSLKDVAAYRNLFSVKNTGISGKKGNKTAIVERLQYFFKNNPEYTMKDVLKTAEYYVKNFKNLTGFLVQADYFIYKFFKSVRQLSRLEEYIEDIDDFLQQDNQKADNELII